MLRFPLTEAFSALDDLVVLMMVAVGLWLVFRAIQSNRARRSPPPPESVPSEDDLLRRLCAQLDKMEHRLDNLETILLDKGKSKKA